MKTLLFIAMSSVLSIAQNTPGGTVKDVTKNDPLTIDSNYTIHINAKHNNYHSCVLNVHNPGPKGVVAYRIWSITARPNGSAYNSLVIYDLITSEDVPPLTGDFQIELDCNGGLPTSVLVGFLQYEDGTIWSGSTPLDRNAMQREMQAELAHFQKLKLAEQTGGDTEPQTVLPNAPRGPSIAHVKANLDKELHAMQAHADWMQ